MNKKVVLIGCGNVGVSYAYALLQQNSYVNELVLVDVNKEKAEGEAMDLAHGLAYLNTNIKIRMGSYLECKDADIVCITAGPSQRPGKSSRMEDLHKAKDIIKNVTEEIVKSGFQGIYLVASNPLDVMTYLTWKYSKADKSKVIGSGTTLDTARLRYVLSQKLQVSPQHIDAYVVGEHGNSQLVAWSQAKIGMNLVSDYITKEEQEEIAKQVNRMGFEISNKKGYTSYGIATALAQITKAILGDENQLLCVSSYDSVQQIFISTPSIINANGVEKSGIMSLSPKESKEFEQSAQVIKDAIQECER